MDISNGEGVGISLFVQGCPFHCKNCFNPETWDFNGGKEWTKEMENKFLKLASRPYIKRISILGGEPLAKANIGGVLNFVNKVRTLFGNTKIIWLYTGFVWEKLFPHALQIDTTQAEIVHQSIIQQCDILIDGPYIDLQRNAKLKWRGSSNQRVIDVQKSIKQGEIILWCD